ncbi:M28 family peptidase [Geodermatophilus sp. URMC 60]
MTTPQEQRIPRPAGVLALVGLLVVAVVSVLVLAPAAPRGTGTPAEEFSAARAMDGLEQVAVAPRPVGSAEHARVRDHLLAALDALGWRTEVHQAVGATDVGEPGTQPVALVRNVVATLPGTDPTGTVLLAAHYDTVAGSPGAGDDGLGMGVLLEIARALTADGVPRPRNDVVVLLTDAEEPGLLGAEAFTRERAASLGTTVVLNHEARGAWGTPATFRTTSPNGALLDALARSPGAMAESASEAAFEALPNDSDLTPFAAAGLHGLDTAISAGGAHYHSPVDDLEHLSPASVQQMGEVSLAVTRQLAATDLTAVPRGAEQVVTTLPWGLLRYPQGLEVPLALAALALALVVLVLRRRQGALTLPRTALGGLGAVAALAAAGLAGWGVWRAALAVDPGQASAVVGEPYRPVLYQAAVLLAAVGAVLAVVGLLRRWTGPDATAVGALAVLAVTGALVALTVPGVSGVLVLPTLCAAAGAAVHDLLPRRWTGLRAAVLVLASAGVAVLLGPGAWLGFDVGLGLGGPFSAVLAGLLALLVLPVVGLAWPPPRAGRRPGWRTVGTPVAALVLAVVLTGAGLAVNREGATPPRQEQLVYGLDADTGRALWASWREPPSAWSASLLTEPPAALDAVLPHTDGRLLAHGPAPAVDLPAPEVAVLSDTRRGPERELVLRLRSARGAPAVGLWVDTAGASVRSARVAGRDLAVHGPRGSWDLGFVLEAVPADGVEVRLTLDQRADPLTLRLGDRSTDLGVVPGSTPPSGRVLVTPALWVTRTARL